MTCSFILKLILVTISTGAERYFLAPVNFPKAQLCLKTGNRLTVLPEPKVACDLLVARPAFNLRFVKNTCQKNQVVALRRLPPV